MDRTDRIDKIDRIDRVHERSGRRIDFLFRTYERLRSRRLDSGVEATCGSSACQCKGMK
jgi:hypothetical protein